MVAAPFKPPRIIYLKAIDHSVEQCLANQSDVYVAIAELMID